MSLYALQNPLMKKQTAAALMNVSVRTVERLVQTGALPAVKVGGQTRFVLQDVERYLMTRRAGVTA